MTSDLTAGEGTFSCLVAALTARAYVGIALGEPVQAERDANEALAVAARTPGYLRLPDTVECLARLEADGANHQNAARLFGAADAVRQRTGQVRFPVYEVGYDAAVAVLRDSMGQQAFDIAWAEGTALSTEQAISYAQRGRGERKRPTSGWASLTPTERDIVAFLWSRIIGPLTPVGVALGLVFVASLSRRRAA